MKHKIIDKNHYDWSQCNKFIYLSRSNTKVAENGINLKIISMGRQNQDCKSLVVQLPEN